MQTTTCHIFDGDACCVVCSHDGAEWWHWRKNTYEGRAQPEIREPACRPMDSAKWDQLEQSVSREINETCEWED